MENKIYNVTLEEMQEIKKTIADNIFIAEIDGKEIKKLFDYLEKIAEIMDFPVEKRSLLTHKLYYNKFNFCISGLGRVRKSSICT